MRLFYALAAIAIPFASTPAQTPPAKGTVVAADQRLKPLGGAHCQRTDVHRAEGQRKGQFNRLGELPPGELILSVYREIDGCHEPVIVRHGYGFAPRQGEQPQPRARRW